MKKKRKLGRKLLSFLLTLALVLCLMPGMGLTAKAESAPVTYLDASGKSQTCGSYTEVTDSIDMWSEGWYVVNRDVTFKSTARFTGDVNIILCDNAKLTFDPADGSAYIALGMGSLTIYAQSTGNSMGELVASSNGNYTIRTENGNFTINGGKVTATASGSNDYCMAVSASNGNVIINGGIINANGYQNGIRVNFGDNVKINGGTVTAQATKSSAIGGTVKNKNAGVGWTDESGSGEGTTIAVSETGQTLNSYKRVQFEAPAHTHSFTYSLNDAGDTITATCNADDCPLTDSKATLTIAAPQHTAVGDGKNADAQITDENQLKGSATVSYYATDADSNKTGNALTSAPTDAGTYWAEITLTNGGSGANDSATAHVVYTITNPDYNVTLPTDLVGGTVTADKTSAKYGDTVTLTIEPDNGFTIKTVKYNDTAITANEGVYSFIMPTEAVTVSATFVGKDTTLTLSTEGNSGTTCTAKLLDSSYNEISSVTKKTGEEFILSIDKDEAHSYKVSFSPNATASMKEFSVEDYKAYINSTKSESLNTSLYWVTMPGVNADSVNMMVTFAEAKTFTILYQPTTSADEVWVKFGYTENNQDKLVTAKMSPDAKMGNVAVWSLKMSAAFNPDKIAFATSESAAESANTEAATVSETSGWSNITDGQYLIVGNNAKTVIAAFTDDSDSSDVDREATVISIGDDAEYQIAICVSGESGSVTAPTAPTKEGYDFVAWRGYEGITAKDYAANTEISVKENMVFSAVWQPSTPNVKLNLNGGTGIANAEFTVPYNDNTTLASLTPVKSGYSFAGWSVAKDVTEDGKLYTRGAPFDTGTKITADLELTAQWKHVHAYGYVQIGAVSSLATKYEKYAPYLHIKICGCGDVDLEAHSLDSSGRCVCGYSKPAAPLTAELNVSYGQWLNGNYTEKMAEVPENFAVNSEVSVSAPGKWGSLKFSKWQYSTDNGESWDDASACSMMSFIIPGNMKMRALYVNDTQKPEVSMSATTYETTASDGNLYDSILFRMNYKLPDGYTYVDSGVRSGDNAGISYYELKERTATMNGEMKAISYGIGAAMTVLQGGYLTTFDTSVTEQYYAKRENSVLDESGMTAAKLADYMYQSKPINIKDAPLYWNYKPNTTGQSGSINALTPVGFAQRNNGDHYIYAIAWLRYKKPDGKVETIWTDAMATTLNGVPSSGSVSKTGE